MMTGNVDTNNINWEYALHDIRHIVCRHLPVEELYNVTKVNAAWRNAALLEAEDRDYIQGVRLPHQFDNPSQSQVPLLFRMFDSFNKSVIIYDADLARSYFNLDKKVCNEAPSLLKETVLNHFKSKLPQKTILLISACKYLTTEDVKTQNRRDEREQELKNYVYGLFFPSNINSQIYVNIIGVKNCVGTPRTINMLSRQLDLRISGHPNSTLLIIIGSTAGYKFAEQFLKKIETSIQAGKETVWVSIFKGNLSGFDNQSISSEYTLGLVVLKISGPRVQSWNAMINARLSHKQIERKLYALKKKVTPRRHCTGLLYGPLQQCNSSILMSSLKRIFPSIPFVGLFNKEDSLHFTKKFARYVDPNIQLTYFDKLRAQISTYTPIQDWSRYMSIIIIASD